MKHEPTPASRQQFVGLPLPMEELLLTLKTHLEDVGEGLPLLPHSGELLGNVARILLKTNKQGATSEEEIKSLIHQAVVRRDVTQLHSS